MARAADLLLPVSAAVAALLAVVVASYRQTVQAYATSGGAYTVASANLGRPAGLVAASALLVDYVLTVAVSVSAGVLALTSAVPALHPLLLELAVAALAALTLANLRGLREAGLAFALPTYGFIAMTLAMLAAGASECLLAGCPRAQTPNPDPVGPAAAAVGALVLARAFASGCTALTGVEAIANGVGAFRAPQARNAARTSPCSARSPSCCSSACPPSHPRRAPGRARRRR